MHYLVVSFSHKNTDLVTREQLALDSKERRGRVARRLLTDPQINEVILLSTCNRVEFITSVRDPYDATETILREIADYSGLHLEELEGRADLYEDNGAIHHIFSVASGLDSLVVGETQISGQLKDAYKEAFEEGFCGQKLGRVMHYAFKCSAQVRNLTDISKNPVSIASAAVAMAEDMVGSLEGREAVVVGAGEMGTLAAKHLMGRGARVTLVGRDREKVERVAREIDPSIAVATIADLPQLINRIPLLFSATSSPEPIITDSLVEPRAFRRVWFDMAVPRDIEVEERGIEVVAVDDLKAIVEKNMTLREEQAKEGYKIVGRFVNEFFHWLQTLEIEPIIKEIRSQAREAALAELERAVKKGFIRPEDRKNIEKLLHNAFNRFLHRPTKKLKGVANEPKADTIAEAIKFFFDIEEDVGLNRYKCEYYMNLRSEREV
ncbi:MAG: glutamyl-tRNA reductase [Epsilonproteobacteria bacterium]|nr:glutamyl-tRNA reductase [Campylobacterota bacterium]NPA56542.1 glutamyl-tRNA reductase [Campylobacterota bacterium]